VRGRNLIIKISLRRTRIQSDAIGKTPGGRYGVRAKEGAKGKGYPLGRRVKSLEKKKRHRKVTGRREVPYLLLREGEYM